MEETAHISEGQGFPDLDWQRSNEEGSQSGQKKGREDRQRKIPGGSASRRPRRISRGYLKCFRQRPFLCCPRGRQRKSDPFLQPVLTQEPGTQAGDRGLGQVLLAQGQQAVSVKMRVNTPVRSGRSPVSVTTLPRWREGTQTQATPRGLGSAPTQFNLTGAQLDLAPGPGTADPCSSEQAKQCASSSSISSQLALRATRGQR